MATEEKVTKAEITEGEKGGGGGQRMYCQLVPASHLIVIDKASIVGLSGPENVPFFSTFTNHVCRTEHHAMK